MNSLFWYTCSHQLWEEDNQRLFLLNWETILSVSLMREENPSESRAFFTSSSNWTALGWISSTELDWVIHIYSMFLSTWSSFHDDPSEHSSGGLWSWTKNPCVGHHAQQAQLDCSLYKIRTLELGSWYWRYEGAEDLLKGLTSWIKSYTEKHGVP